MKHFIFIVAFMFAAAAFAESESKEACEENARSQGTLDQECVPSPTAEDNQGGPPPKGTLKCLQRQRVDKTTWKLGCARS